MIYHTACGTSGFQNIQSSQYKGDDNVAAKCVQLRKYGDCGDDQCHPVPPGDKSPFSPLYEICLLILCTAYIHVSLPFEYRSEVYSCFTPF
jgi:hypothetical protein